MFTERNKPSLLNLAVTKYPDGVTSMQMLAPFGKSDHEVVMLDLRIQLQEDKQLPPFNWYYKKNMKTGTR